MVHPKFIEKAVKRNTLVAQQSEQNSNIGAVFVLSLQSGIDVHSPLNEVASEKFDKKNKRSALKCANSCNKI